MGQIQITVGDVQCPTCGAGEMHPHDEGKPFGQRRILIKGFKVHHSDHWWSQCLVCSGYYDEDLNEQPEEHDGDKGWF